MIEPGTAMLIATAIKTAAEGGGSYFANKKEKQAQKLRSKETKRETAASMANEAMQRGAELTAHGLSSRNKLGKRRSKSLQDTADLVRGALNI